MLRLAVKRNHSKAIAEKSLKSNRSIHQESRGNCSNRSPSFVIYDSKAKGFPIRHASQGFQDLLGYSAESIGEASHLLNPVLLLQSDELKNFATGLSGHEVSESIHRMARAAEAAQSATAVPSSWPLLILRRCSGEFLVCDIAWCKNSHPVLGWSYHAAMVRNISDKISVARLLVAASKEATYTELCAEWAEMAEDMGLPPVSQKLSSCSEELHAAAQKMWKDELAKGVKPKSTTKRREEDMSSIWSRSTASTMASSSSKEKKHAKLETEATIGSHHLGALIGMLPVADEEGMQENMETHEGDHQKDQKASFFEGFESASDEFEECESMSDGSLSSDGPPLFDEVEDPTLHVDRPHLREMSAAFVLASLSSNEFPIALRSAGVESSAKSWPSGPAMKLKQGSDARQLLEPTQPKAGELWKSFCECFEEQRFFKTETGGGIALLNGLEVALPAGELAFVQPFHGRLGNAIDCLVYVKHIELDDCPYLLALYSQLPDDDYRLEEEFDHFSSQVDEVISEFASDFFYYAPMRRQRMRGGHRYAEGCELSSSSDI